MMTTKIRQAQADTLSQKFAKCLAMFLPGIFLLGGGQLDLYV